MNIDTWADDLAELKPGTVVIYNTDVKAPVERDDLVLYPASMTQMARTLNPKLAKLVSNMIYVGLMSEMLEWN